MAWSGSYKGLANPNYGCFAYRRHHAVKSRLHPSSLHSATNVDHVHHLCLRLCSKVVLSSVFVRNNCWSACTLDGYRFQIPYRIHRLDDFWITVIFLDSRVLLFPYCTSTAISYWCIGCYISMTICTTCTRLALKDGLPLHDQSIKLPVTLKHGTKFNLTFTKLGFFAPSILSPCFSQCNSWGFTVPVERFNHPRSMWWRYHAAGIK